MKRIICLLLVVIMACSVLMACNLEQFFATENKPEDSNPTTATTEPTSPPAPDIVSPTKLYTPSFVHGDNMTDEDICFIMEHAGNEVPICSYPPYVPNDVSGFLNYMKARNFTYYEISIDFDAPHYYICAYLDKSWFDNFIIAPPGTADSGYLAEYYSWYKFEQNEAIPEEIDNCIFMGGFVLFDCVIEKDLLNGKEYSYECKFFASLRNGYSDIGADFASTYEIYNDYILYHLDYDFLVEDKTPSTDYLFLAPSYYQQYHRADEWKGVIENDGQRYMTVFSSTEKYNPDTFSFEAHRENIGNLYDQILPYLTVIEKEGDAGYNVCISLDNLAKVWDALP